MPRLPALAERNPDGVRRRRQRGEADAGGRAARQSRRFGRPPVRRTRRAAAGPIPPGSEIDRNGVYVTNVVKHFKFEPRGKARIHKKPNRTEIVACRPWLRHRDRNRPAESTGVSRIDGGPGSFRPRVPNHAEAGRASELHPWPRTRWRLLIPSRFSDSPMIRLDNSEREELVLDLKKVADAHLVKARVPWHRVCTHRDSPNRNRPGGR